MRVRISLRIKLTFLVIIISLSIFVILAYFISNQEKEALRASFRQQAISTAQALNASLTTRQDFENKTKLQNTIYKIMWLNPEVSRININFLTRQGLKIIASNDTASIGHRPSADNLVVLKKDEIIVNENTTKMPNSIWVLTPIHISGKLVGTYEVNLSLETLNKIVSKTQKQITIIMLEGILVIVMLMVLLLGEEIIHPINELKKGMNVFGQGKLNYRISSKRNDEFGDLAQGFNMMAQALQQTYQRLEESQKSLEQKVKERTQELEEAKQSLETKVRARTKELRELAQSLEQKVKERTKSLQKKTLEVTAKSNELKKKVAELEKMNKLMVDRELRMRELKKEIGELKEKLNISKENI